MKKILLLAAFALLGLSLAAQTNENQYPEGPGLEFVCELHVLCAGTYTVGDTSHGTRTVIPIVGGTFEGPNMKGEVLSGGADYQLGDREHGRTEIEAI